MQQLFRPASRAMLALTFSITGFLHFYDALLFVKIVPPGFPNPAMLVRISGVCEIAGALGLLAPRLRLAASWGLIALLIAVFPANIYMAVAPQNIPGTHYPSWVHWLRLPLQFVLIAWVWYAGREPSMRTRPARQTSL